MKKIVFYFLGVLILFLAGCQKDIIEAPCNDDKVAKIIDDREIFSYWSNQTIGENLSIEFKTKNLTIDDFKKTGHLWSDAEASELFKSKKWGVSPELAFALLIFDSEGKLIYNNDYWKLTENGDSFEKERYFTDLRTFREIVAQETALPKYAKGSTGHLWVYDSYQTVFKTDEEWDSFLEERDNPPSPLAVRTTSQNLIKKGNLFWGKWPYDWVVKNYGHMGIVSQAPNMCYPNMTLALQNTYSVEATPPSVIEGVMANHDWAASDILMRKILWYPSLSDEQRNEIVEYVRDQIGEPYYFPLDDEWIILGSQSDKNDQDRWYCSKLAWRAYKEVLSIDIDADNGGLVFPKDIYRSSYLLSIDI